MVKIVFTLQLNHILVVVGRVTLLKRAFGIEAAYTVISVQTQ